MRTEAAGQAGVRTAAVVAVVTLPMEPVHSLVETAVHKLVAVAELLDMPEGKAPEQEHQRHTARQAVGPSVADKRRSRMGFLATDLLRIAAVPVAVAEARRPSC